MIVGQVVVHMSGGYMMTVEKIDGRAARCVWFDRDMFLCKRTFLLNTLIPIRALPTPVNPVYGNITFN